MLILILAVSLVAAGRSVWVLSRVYRLVPRRNRDLVWE